MNFKFKKAYMVYQIIHVRNENENHETKYIVDCIIRKVWASNEHQALTLFNKQTAYIQAIHKIEPVVFIYDDLGTIR